MKPIYLDHAATTPLRPEVVEAMAPYAHGLVGNPSAVHQWGRAARAALEGARERIAFRLAVRPEEVRFTRGGSESANLAVLGRWAAVRGSAGPPAGTSPGRIPTFLRSAVEHSAVREAVDSLAPRGARVEVLGVDERGRIDLPTARDLAERRVALVSCQWVNPEVGLMLPIPEVAATCEHAGVPLHVDAVQAVGRVPLELGRLPIALLTLSAHKLGGPKGVGALVVRRDVEIGPVLFGGGQEGGLRPGTEDVAGAVGLATALEVSLDRMSVESERLARLRDRLGAALVAAIEGARVHGEGAPRAPHVLGLGIPGLPRDVLPVALDVEGIGASAGSACASGSTRPSPTLLALYGERATAYAPLRISLGWTTTEDEIDEAARRIPEVVERVRTAMAAGPPDAAAPRGAARGVAT